MNQMLISRPSVTVADELHERCDSCNAAAKLQATFDGSGDLAFCGHHANKFAERIVATAASVVLETGFAWRGASG
jgi:hypothetical protein